MPSFRDVEALHLTPSPIERMQSLAWSALRHAYGPAGDIPGLLARARHAPAPRHHRGEPQWRAMLAICVASLGGDLERARLLDDGPDEDEFD